MNLTGQPMSLQPCCFNQVAQLYYRLGYLLNVCVSSQCLTGTSLLWIGRNYLYKKHSAQGLIRTFFYDLMVDIMP